MANRESWGAVLFLAALLAGAVFLFSGLYAPGPERAGVLLPQRSAAYVTRLSRDLGRSAPGISGQAEAVKPTPLLDAVQEKIAAAEPAARARAVVGVYACMAKWVIPGAFIFIAEDLVCLAHLFELFLSGLVAGVQVRVIFFREFAVGALDLVVRGRFRHAEYLVIIAFICHCTFSP